MNDVIFVMEAIFQNFELEVEIANTNELFTEHIYLAIFRVLFPFFSQKID